MLTVPLCRFANLVRLFKGKRSRREYSFSRGPINSTREDFCFVGSEGPCTIRWSWSSSWIEASGEPEGCSQVRWWQSDILAIRRLSRLAGFRHACQNIYLGACLQGSWKALPFFLQRLKAMHRIWIPQGIDSPYSTTPEWRSAQTKGCEKRRQRSVVDLRRYGFNPFGRKLKALTRVKQISRT